MSRTSELAKNTAILTFGKICTQSINFFMLPLYTAILDTSEYGLFDLLVTYATLLLPMINWQFDQGLFRFLLEARKDKEKQKILLSTTLVVSVVQALLFTGIFFLVRPLLTLEYVDFLLFYIILHIFTGLLMQFSRGVGRISVYTIASFLSAVSTVTFNVVALAVLRLGIFGLFAATVASQIVTLIYLVITTKFWTIFSFRALRFDAFIEVKNYSIPLIPNNLAWWIVNSSDRMVISHFIGIAANGIFTVASKFSNVFISFYNVVNLSWTETVSLHFNDEDRDAFLSETITTIFKLFAAACLMIVAAMPFLYPILIDNKYAEGYNHVLILMYAMLFRVMVGMYSCIYIATKQSKKVAITSISAAVINLAVDLLLVRRIGLYAASLSSLIAFLVMFIARYQDMKHIVDMKIKKNALIPTLIIAVLLPLPYYSKNSFLQLIAMIAVVLYGIIMNFDTIKICIRKLIK